MKEINEILHTEMNKQIQAAVDKRVGTTCKYSIDNGLMRLVATTPGYQAKSKYELKADLVFTS